MSQDCRGHKKKGKIEKCHRSEKTKGARHPDAIWDPGWNLEQQMDTGRKLVKFKQSLEVS